MYHKKKSSPVTECSNYKTMSWSQCKDIYIKQNIVLRHSYSYIRALAQLHISIMDKNYRSDGQVVEASASGAINSGLIPSRAKPITSNWYSQLPCLTLIIKGTVWLRTSLVPLGKALSEMTPTYCG